MFSIFKYKILGYILIVTASFAVSLDSAWSQVRAEVDNRDHKIAFNLYLMRNLEQTLETWKPPSDDPIEMGNWVYTTRKRLEALKTTAEAYRLDEDIIRAYGDVLVLLKEYEVFLKEVVLYDLIADVARPAQKHFAFIATGETSDLIRITASAATAGSIIGTCIPGVGNVVGGVMGIGVGGTVAVTKTALYAILEYRDKISNEAKDNAVREAKIQYVEILAKHFASTRERLQVLAKILGGKEKYGWGSEVGFDGSITLPLIRQLSLRPNDPFLHVTIGIKDAEGSPASAVNALAKAAELIPQDFDAQVDVLDLDRMELYLTAAHIAEYWARRSNNGGSDLASLSVSYYRKARDCVQLKDVNWPREIKIMYARACVLAGETQESNEIMEQLLKGSPDDPWLLYDYACVKSMMHESDTYLSYLRRSFSIQPRRQPYTLEDNRLAFGISRSKEQIEKLCANPLVGKWKDDKNLVLEFFEDGAMKQTTLYEVKYGKYEQVDEHTIKLNRKDSVKSYKYELGKNRLKIEGLGKTYELNRSVDPLIGKWKYGYDEFDFQANGSWRRNRKGVVTTGTYLTISRNAGKSFEIRSLQDNILKPEVVRRYEARVVFNTLHVRPWEDTSWYDYKRK